MFFLKKLLFDKRVYPVFYDNLDIAQQNNSAVVFFEADTNNKLLILVIMNFKAVIFTKEINSDVSIEYVEFKKELTDFTTDKKELILKLKDFAVTYKNHNFIENFNEALNRFKINYNISLEQQQNIWNIVLNLDTAFLNNNTPITSPTDTINKWVD